MTRYKSEEDYLKAIFEKSKQLHSDIVANKALVDYFGHSIQAVNEMVKKLDQKGFLVYIPYKGSRLTELGCKEAISLITKHRLWELFLVRHCHYDWSQVHDEAERLEHATSEMLVERLRELLGQPTRCPHGNPIPDSDGQYQVVNDLPLSDCEAGECYCLKRVADQPQVLSYLSNHHLAIGQPFTIVKRDSTNRNFVLKTNRQTVMIGFNIADQLFVKLCEI